MDYDQFSKGHTYGTQKIYEMVINTDPCYAYLLQSNPIVDQKIVMAHVYGHCDFFKNNAWFSQTDRKMMDTMANHGTKIRRYMEKYGHDRVENFVDKVLSIENLLDINQLFETHDAVRNRAELEQLAKSEQAKSQEEGPMGHLNSPALRTFMRSKRLMEKKKAESKRDARPDGEDDEVYQEKFPQKPVRDIMSFLIQFAPIQEWQADVIGILREEAYYFLPQRLTKIMNEGWASYWHSTIMTEKACDASEIVDFADRHAGVMVMGRKNINPYKVGIELFRDIEYRWDTGRFGKDYNECDDMEEKENWDLKLGKGKEKIFEIRRAHNDVSFIDEFLTPEFCNRQQLFTYKFNPRSGRMEIDDRDFEGIKSKLLNQLTNFGSPVIEVEDANFQNRGELLLRHIHYGVDLDLSYAAQTLKNVHALWKRPVCIVTQHEDKESIFSFDGKEMKPL